MGRPELGTELGTELGFAHSSIVNVDKNISIVQIQSQYEFCYKTVLEFLVSFDTYANFK